MIQGQTYDWESLSVDIEGLGVAVLLTEVRWSETRPVANVYGKGSAPRGHARGNYGAELTIKLDRREYDVWMKALADAGKTLYSQAPFNVSCAWANDDQPTTTEAFPECTVTGASAGQSQGDENSVLELTLRCTGVRTHQGASVI